MLQTPFHTFVKAKELESIGDLRSPERLKFNCGSAHFKALDSIIRMKLATRWSEVGV